MSHFKGFFFFILLIIQCRKSFQNKNCMYLLKEGNAKINSLNDFSKLILREPKFIFIYFLFDFVCMSSLVDKQMLEWLGTVSSPTQTYTMTRFTSANKSPPGGFRLQQGQNLSRFQTVVPISTMLLQLRPSSLLPLQLLNSLPWK